MRQKKQFLAFFRKARAALAPIEQDHVKELLQLCNPLRDRRLRGVESARCLCESAELGNPVQRFKLLVGHAPIRFNFGMLCNE